jgi:hypothetical protein
MLDLHLARLGVFMRKFLPFRWACAVPVLNAAADFFDAGQILPLWARDDTAR